MTLSLFLFKTKLQHKNGLVIPGTLKKVIRSQRLGAKFYEELNKVKQLCSHMNISVKEMRVMRSKPVRLCKEITVYTI